MTDSKFDEGRINAYRPDPSDEYLTDQMRSDQYAAAAREASQARSDNPQPQPVTRRIHFDSATDSDRTGPDLAKREENFRRTIERATGEGDYDMGDNNYNTNYDNNYSGSPDDSYQGQDYDRQQYNDQYDKGQYKASQYEADQYQTGQYQTQQYQTQQYDLDDFDDADQDDGHLRQSSRRPDRQARNYQSGRYSQGTNKILKDILGGLQQSLALLFSRRPMQIFHLNLHWGSIGILALVNSLLVAGLNAAIYSKTLQPVLELARMGGKSGLWKAFGVSLLGQLIILLLTGLLIFLMGLVLKSDRKPLKQYLQTPVLATEPYSLVLLLALIFSFFAPGLALGLAVTGKIHAFIYLYAGFQKGHQPRKNSPYWLFFILIALVLLAQFYFVRWAFI